MDDPTDARLDPRKVRFGLALVGIVLVVALVLLLIIDSAFGKAIMVAIVAVAVVRAYLLSRWLRNEGPASEG